MKAAEELAAKEAEAEEAAIVSTSSSEPETTQEETVEAAEVKPEVKEEAKTEKPAETKKAENASSNGRTVQVSATGYSTQQANLSTHTATGIDLRVNPRVIAVDRSYRNNQ